MYTIKIIRTDGTFEEHVIQRQYEDLEWLEHCLTTARNIDGIIVPPIPPKPAVTTQMAEARSRKQLGSSTKTLMGDEFHKDCHAMERYLNLLLSHSHFGQDPQLETFLTKIEAPARAKIKKGLLSKLSDRIENRKSDHKDCEEFFQKEREWVNDYGETLRNASENFNKMVYSQQRLSTALGHLSTALNLGMGTNEGYNGIVHRLMARFSEGLNDLKQGFEVQCYNDENILGSTLELYSRYIEAEKDMLFRRTCLLVNYENANKALDKAKGNKYELAEKAKLDAERAFEECSDVARQEIKKFHRHRVSSLQDSLTVYAEAQLKTACDTYAVLANALFTLEQFALPRPPNVKDC